MVHENWRFRPWYRVLKGWIAEGALGDIGFARLVMINSGFLPDAHGIPRGFGAPALHADREAADDLGGADPSPRHDALPLRRAARRGARANRTVLRHRRRHPASIFLETAAGAPVIVSGHHGGRGLSAARPRPAGDHRQQGQRRVRRLDAAPRSAPGPAARPSTTTRVIRRASTASWRISSIASTAGRRSRPIPPTISRRCASSSTPIGPPGGTTESGAVSPEDAIPPARAGLQGCGRLGYGRRAGGSCPVAGDETGAGPGAGGGQDAAAEAEAAREGEHGASQICFMAAHDGPPLR